MRRFYCKTFFYKSRSKLNWLKWWHKPFSQPPANDLAFWVRLSSSNWLDKQIGWVTSLNATDSDNFKQLNILALGALRIFDHGGITGLKTANSPKKIKLLGDKKCSFDSLLVQQVLLFLGKMRTFKKIVFDFLRFFKNSNFKNWYFLKLSNNPKLLFEFLTNYFF